MHPGGARAHGGDGARRGEPEVVVPVEVDRNVRAEPPARALDEAADGLGCGNADRVDDDGLLRPCLAGCLVDRLEEGSSARVPSTPKKAIVIPLGTACETASSMRRSTSSWSSRSAPSLRSLTGASITAARRPSSSRASTSARSAREKPHTSASAPRPWISSTARRSSSETRGKPASMRSMPSSSRSRAISSFSRGRGRRRPSAPRRAASCRTGRRRRRCGRRRSGPVQTGRSHRKSSGYRQSFSGPSAVIRKLSSSRRPPPPSQ